MASMEKVVRSRIDENLKTHAEKILKRSGSSTSEAIRILFQEIVRQKRLPFDVKIPSKKTQAALKENISKSKRYSNTKEFWKDVGIDPKANGKKKKRKK